MTTITLKGKPIHTLAALPEINTRAPDFSITKSDLTDTALADFSGKTIILNIFPSIDTPVCAASVRHFNEKAGQSKNTVVLCISKDIPFALGRFCGAENINNVITGSVFRNPDFGKHYGVEIIDGPLKGLLSRAIVIINDQGNIVYTEQVPEIAQEPDYEKALQAI